MRCCIAPENDNQIIIQNFINLALDWKWEKIDKQKYKYKNNSYFIDWAKNHILNENPDISDLACTMLEITDINLNSDDIQKLEQLRQKTNPNYKYAIFRALCVFSNKIDEIIKIQENPDFDQNNFIEQIKNNISKYLDDEEVSEIAEYYVNILNQKLWI